MLAVTILTFLAFRAPLYAEQERMVQVAIGDETTKRRIPDTAELWLTGTGSVRFRKECDRLRDGSLSCSPINVGMRRVGQPLELHIYVGGREVDSKGRDSGGLRVPLKLTAEMCPEGCARDRVTVLVSDTHIEIYGAPVYAAGFEDGVKARRR